MSPTLLSRLVAVLVVSLATALMACGGNEGGGQPTAAPDPTTDTSGAPSSLVVSEVSRRLPHSVAARSVGEASAPFAVDMYLMLTEDDDGNVVFSPYSVAVALAMTLNGARGQTAAEMATVLHAELASDLNAGFNAIEQALDEVPGEYEIGMPSDDPVLVELSTVSQLWGQEGVGFLDEFLDELAASYGAGMRLVDYAQDAEGARQSINRWVSDETRERIPELVQEDALTANTRLVLVNAIYLNSPWRFPFFEDRTSDEPFTTLAGNEIVVSMMRLRESLAYASGAGYEAVVLPYIGGDLSMLVVVPDEERFESVEDRIGDVVAEFDESLSRREVVLEFPRFEFRTQVTLKQVLAELGMPTAFSDMADFSGMTDELHLQIGGVVHEAFISVNEEGTEAAAATAVIMRPLMGVIDPPPPIELTVDRPFLFLIRHNDTGAVLFMGRVLDPTAE